MTTLELRAQTRYRTLLSDLVKRSSTKAEISRKVGVHSVEIGPILDGERGVSMRVICTAAESLGLHIDYFFAESNKEAPAWQDYLLDEYDPGARTPPDKTPNCSDLFGEFSNTSVARAVSEETMNALLAVDSRQPLSVDGYAAIALTMEMSSRSKNSVLGPDDEPKSDERTAAALQAFLETTRGQSAEPHEIAYMRKHRWPEGYKPDAACYQSLWESLRWGKWTDPL